MAEVKSLNSILKDITKKFGENVVNSGVNKDERTRF